MTRSTFFCASLFCASSFFSLAGCDSKPAAPKNVAADVAAMESATDDLTQALDLLAKLDQVDLNAVQPDVLFYLNRWMQAQPKDASWKLDEMTQRLPRRIREAMKFESLADLRVDPADVYHVREALWLRDVSQWVAAQPAPRAFETWLKQHEPPLSTETADRLKVSERLFDWTIRNIQLDELPPPPKEATAGPSTNPADTIAQTAHPAARGEPGPGYRRQPWQTLLFGHGDAWERARLFLLLARQQGVDVVMLGIDEPSSNQPAKPWIPAALIDQRLYLFDTTLGLPIPTANGGIATLEQVRAEPKLLRALDVAGLAPYPVAAEQLEQVVALIDSDVETLSHRMRLIEAKLPVKYRLALTTSLTELADRVKSLPGIKQTSPWGLGWEVTLYMDAVTRRMQHDPRLVPRELLETRLFSRRLPMMLGRLQHLQGNFDDHDERSGAKTYYMNSRIPDAALDALDRDKDLQRALGLVRGEQEDDETWRKRIVNVRQLVKEAKGRASYWLGLVHFEQGDYTSAADWFNERYLKREVDGEWVHGARYNLGRAYEALGETAKARATYNESTSLQKQGDRARLGTL